MNLKKNLFLSCLILCFFSCVSCVQKKDKQKSNTIYLNLFEEPPTLDPRLACDVTSMNLIYQLFEGLMRLDPKKGVVLGCAKDVSQSEDGLTYTFTLGNNYWSDGSPLLASDFVETWKEILQPSFPSPMSYRLFLIEGARALKEGKASSDQLGIKLIDKKKFSVTLEKPSDFFLELLAMPCTFPVNRRVVDQNSNWAKEAVTHVSNGPFSLFSWNHDVDLILKKRKASSAKIGFLSFCMVSDQHTEEYLFENGELDLVGHPFSKIEEEARDYFNKKGLVESVKVFVVYLYKFNTLKAPFNNASIRKALSFSIDRKKIKDFILANQCQEAYGIIPQLPDYESAPLFVYNPQKGLEFFKKGLQELNIDVQDFPVISIQYNQSNDHKKIAQAIQECWRSEFNLRSVLEVKEWKQHLADLQKGQFDVAKQTWVGDSSDPFTYLAPYQFCSSEQGGMMNETGWENLEFQKLLFQIENTKDKNKRALLVHEAEALLMNEMPFIPLFFLNYEYLKQPYVVGEWLTPFGFFDLSKIEKRSSQNS